LELGFCSRLCYTIEGCADREEAYRRFTGNFEAGQTIEIAENLVSFDKMAQ